MPPAHTPPQLANRHLPATLQSLAALPPFLHTAVRLPEVHKTGLGSSAALITSLVSALLLHLQIVPADALASQGGLEGASAGRKLAHNVAQYVHCLAQGKVGSGFDVASAVFGSQLYTRFDPLVIQPLMDNHLVSALPLFCFPSLFCGHYFTPSIVGERRCCCAPCARQQTDRLRVVPVRNRAMRSSQCTSSLCSDCRAEADDV